MMAQRRAPTGTGPFLIVMAALSIVLSLAYLLLRPALAALGRPAAPASSGIAHLRLPEVEGAAVAASAPIDDDAPARIEEGSPPVPATPLPTPPILADSPDDVVPPDGISYLDDVERLILEKTNVYRADNPDGPPLDVLAAEPGLQKAARVHSDDMLVRDFFDHINPDGQSPSDRIAILDRRLIGAAGENIASHEFADVPNADAIATAFMEQWMSSPDHRANILRADYTHLGVGVSRKGEVVMATQNFAEVRAFLDAPLPSSVQRGGVVALGSQPYPSDALPAVQFEVWSSERGVAVDDALPIGIGRIEAEPGRYKLRFFFPKAGDPGAFSIFTGPELEVLPER